jgi:hypothetical protein
MSIAYDGWDIDIYIRRDDYIMLRPCFYNETARHRILREDRQAFQFYAKSESGHIGIVGQAKETYAHTAKERASVLENISVLINMQLKEKGE